MSINTLHKGDDDDDDDDNNNNNNNNNNFNRSLIKARNMYSKRNYELPEDGQHLRPKHVGSLIN